jgi:cytochrome d ubiquinol oxidase subunit II
LFTRLFGPALPIVVLSVLCGSAALLLLRRGTMRLVRLLAAVAVAALVIGWGAAQYPYVLGTHASVDSAAAPAPSLVALTVVFGAAGLLVVPSLALLYTLQQRGQLRPD